MDERIVVAPPDQGANVVRLVAHPRSIFFVVPPVGADVSHLWERMQGM